MATKLSDRMNIAVCLKRVPATTTGIKIAADGKSIDTNGVEFVINTYDEFAIEEALKIKEKMGGEVVIVSVDPDGTDSIVRKALAMGANRGIIIKCNVNFDGYPVAKLLADTLSKAKYDLIFFGKQAIDDDSYQVPSMVAHLLKLPRINVVTKLEIIDGKAKAHRQIEGGEEVYEVPLPAIISAQKGLNEPRYPSLKGIMAAKGKKVEVITPGQIDSRVEVVKMEYPLQRPAGRIVGKGVEAVPELVKLLREEAKII